MNEPIAGGAKEMDTLFSDTIPSPFEHLGNHNFVAGQVSHGVFIGRSSIACPYLYHFWAE